MAAGLIRGRRPRWRSPGRTCRIRRVRREAGVRKTAPLRRVEEVIMLRNILPVLAASALLAAGCSQIREEYTLNPDGSGKVAVRRLAPMPMTLCSPAALEGLVAIPFEERLTRDLSLIYAQDRPLSAAARALIAYIRTRIPRHGLVRQR